ncbi:MAG: hypothetical protein HY758_01850 [Nitrospirae bacterium]|nr:hypothetical protein [Nitrospirota bacterium]
MRVLLHAKNLTTLLFILALITGSVNSVFAAPLVLLKVLNVPNEFGDIIIVRGNNVEVEFTVSDPMFESSNEDIIRLVRIEDGIVATQMTRGKELSGSRSLGTQKTVGNDVLGKLQVQYLSKTTKQVLATSLQTVFLVDNQSILELTGRTGAVEKEVITVKEKVILAENLAQEAKAAAAVADTKAAEAMTKADLADLKAIIANQKVEEAKYKIELVEVISLGAKTKADTADVKAMEAKTKADTADVKALSVR